MLFRSGVQRRLRCGLIPLIAALAGYNYVALGAPGSERILQQLGFTAGLAAASAGGWSAAGATCPLAMSEALANAKKYRERRRFI